MVADRFTKALLLSITICLVVLCVRAFWPAQTAVHGAATELQFSADKDRFYFYDPAAQKVYAYPSNGGHPQSTVELLKPGGELRPVPTY